MTDNVGVSGWTSSSTVAVAWTPDIPAVTTPLTDMDGSYTVSWTAETYANLYTLQESTLSGTTWGSWLQIYNGSGLSAARFKPDGNYRYRVKACDSFACSGWSTIAYTEVGYGFCQFSAEESSSTDTSSETPGTTSGSSNGNSKTDPETSDAEALAGPGC